MGKRIHTMEFNKVEIVNNLKTLESAILKARDGIDLNQKSGMDLTKAFNDLDQIGDDLACVRILMNKIECDQITEFPLVERTNFMSGKTFLEEPDRPYYCSPSSEAYWSM